MDDQARPKQDVESESDRRVANFILFGAFLVIVGIGAWLIFALDDARKADDCLSQGRRNCAPVDVQQR